jgi:hypothetical protein
VTGNLKKAFLLGLQMIGLIFAMRCGFDSFLPGTARREASRSNGEFHP